MDEVSRAAALAKIYLSDEEKIRAAGDLQKMLGYFEILKSADVSDISAEEEALSVSALRADKAEQSGLGDDIMKAAPAAANDMFVVPGTLKAEG